MSTEFCQPCQDSPLSILGNVVGILTFVYVLTVGITYRFSVVRRAAVELDTLQLEATFLIGRFKSLKNEVAQKYMYISSASQLQAEMAHNAVVEEIKVLEDTLEKLSHSSDDIRKARRRKVLLGFKYIMWRDELKARLEKLNIWTERFQGFADDGSSRDKREPHLRHVQDAIEKMQKKVDEGIDGIQTCYALQSQLQDIQGILLALQAGREGHEGNITQ